MTKNKSKMKVAAMKIKGAAERDFTLARDAYAAAEEPEAITAAENRMIDAIAGIRDRRMFPHATKAIMLITPTDERAEKVVEALIENKALLNDIVRYTHDKFERVSGLAHGGGLESVESALSPEHMKTLNAHTARARSRRLTLEG